MKKRCIYSYEFEDNSVYIGLTYNINNRNNRHIKDNSSSVNERMKICKNFQFNQLTNFIDPMDAKEQEKKFVEKYKNEGWIILNKTGAGSLGGNILKWQYDNCKEESLKYNTRKELKINSLGCYLRICREKWFELFNHMINGKVKWSKDKCMMKLKIINPITNIDQYQNLMLPPGIING
jgi:predicted GIY-YIG superfamily endonuclease